MRFLFVLILLLSACSQVPAPDSLSAGCTNLNDPFYDDAYRSGNVYFSPFRAGENLTVALTNPDTAASLTLIVTDTSGEVRRDLVTGSTPSGKPLTYTFTQDLEQAEVYWTADAGVPNWKVVCR